MAGNIMQLVNTCYTEALDMVVFAGTFHKFEIWRLNFSPLLTMYNVGLDESTIFKRHKRLEKVYKLDENVVSKLRYPSKLFIVSSSSQYNLSMLLNRLKQSVLWNSRAVFFLVGENFETKCSNASIELTEAWKFNILYAFFICSDENETHLYTFDPFKQVAPNSWEISEAINVNYKNRSDSLVIFKYSPLLTVIDRSICQRLDIDKTADFNGYTVQLIAIENHNMFQRINQLINTSSHTNPQPLSQFMGVDVEVINATFRKLDLEALVTVFNNMGSIDEENKAHGIIDKLLNGSIDMGANERYRRNFWKLETYPHDITDMCMITSQRVHHLPIIHGLTLLMMSQPQALIIFTLLIFAGIVIFMRVLKIEFVAAVLEFLRLLTGMPMFRQLDHFFHGWRLMLLNIVLFNYWINLYFGTQLTSSFAIKRDDPNINSIENLLKSGYDIAGDKSFKEFLRFKALRDRFKEATMADCLQDLKTRGNIACLIDCYQADHCVLMHNSTNVHISEALYSTYVAYIVREDWPLLPRINQVIQNLRENGVYLFFDGKYFYHGDGFFEERKQDEMKMNNDVGFQGKPLSPKKLIHSFYLYRFGVAVGLAAFLAEFFVNICFRIRNKIKRRYRLQYLQ
ncbi:hypothetical protein TSAR_004670 [Trichomalopsis sarcophagae]|uniref:Ionotropic glutamate receptor L-glutamate and glycine-binding domain-containing protein n=1 Tax=Trichomalopsis sarcophagae TaxID=543379 RepID=A0A232EZ40_9HYME|nr:hypothetical protein TSAR_004670 [Trichomalopsis sarcophagae]